jgi:hypothetical protein
MQLPLIVFSFYYPFIIILFLKKLVDSFRAWMIPKKKLTIGGLVIFGKRLNKNFAVGGSYTNYSSDEVGMSSKSAANGAALEAAMLSDGAK